MNREPFPWQNRGSSTSDNTCVYHVQSKNVLQNKGYGGFRCLQFVELCQNRYDKSLYSTDFVGCVHDRMCFAMDRGVADLYEKYMAYCACQHLVT